MHPREIDWVIMGVYFVFVLGIGYTLRRYMKTSTDYFLSGRSIPAWSPNLPKPRPVPLNMPGWNPAGSASRSPLR